MSQVMPRNSPCHVTAPLPHRIKIYYKARKEKGKKIFKSSLSPSPLHSPDPQQSLKKREKGENILRGGNASSIPSGRQTEQASGAPVTTETLLALQVLLTVCHENMCWEMIPIWKSIKRQQGQKARKEMESNLPKGWVNIQSKSSLLNVHKANSLSTGEPPALQTKSIRWQPTSARFWWVSGPRGRCRTRQSLWEQYLAHSAQDVNINTAFPRESWIHSKKQQSSTSCKPACRFRKFCKGTRSFLL